MTDRGIATIIAAISGLLAPGTRLGPWCVGTLIGRGGAGEVYSAHRADGSFEQQAAIKVLQKAWGGGGDA